MEPSTFAAMVIVFASMSDIPDGDLVYVAEVKIQSIYPSLDPYSVHQAVKDGMQYWAAYKALMGEIDVPHGVLQ